MRPTRDEFRSTLWRASLPPLLLLVALAAFVSLLLLQLLRANTWAQQSEGIILRTKDVDRLLLEMENASRDFYTIGGDAFLESYRRAQVQLNMECDILQQRLTNDPAQLQRMQGVRLALAPWYERETQLRALQATVSVNDTRLRLLQEQQQIMNGVRADVGDITKSESALGRERYERFGQASTLAVFGSIGLSISLGVGLALINRGTIVRLTTVYQQALEAEDTRAGELLASNRQFLDLAEAIPQLVWISDGHGKPVYFNTPWTTLTGLTVEHLTANGWEQTLHPEDREAAEVRWHASLRSGEPFEAEYRVKRQSDGTYRWFLCRATPVRDESGKNVRWFGTCTDIETQKQVERQREQVLQTERRARSDLLRTNQIKDQFLATLSHELRTPMTAIMGWIQLLREPTIRENNLDHALDAIDSNSRAQARLIDDLLDMSRILSGKLTIKSGAVDLQQIAQAAMDAVKPAAMQKGVRLNPLSLQGENFSLAGDASRLKQVISNLLSNSIKFTPRDGEITLALGRADATARISVTDTGRGIRAEFLPHVFERFRQADGSTTRQHGGLGLGLAIVKHLVEIHDGTVTAGSDGENRGATFTVELPMHTPMIEPAAGGRQDLTALKPIALTGLKLLVAEDDPGAADVLRTMLEHGGAAVNLASTGIIALEKLRANRYDLLISDIGMPDMDGYELIRSLRNIHAGLNCSIPAIALTAFANKDDRDEAIRAGYQIHLAKPVSPDDLTKAVASLVSQPR